MSTSKTSPAPRSSRPLWPSNATVADEVGAIAAYDGSWEEKWKLWENYIRPFEADRYNYDRPSWYPRPVFVDMHPMLWTGLCNANAEALSGMLSLGFIPTATVTTERDSAELVTVRWRRQHDLGRQPSRVSFEQPVEEAASVDRVRELEDAVNQLTKQLRLIRSKEVEEPQMAPPVQPFIITDPKKQLVALTSGETVVYLQVNYLDPDAAPFCVGLGTANARVIVPCNVVEHQYVLFIAPPHPPGSVPCSVFSAANGRAAKYTRSVWLEYKTAVPEGGQQPLSVHAVNQLLAEMPMPSSNTLIDPSETKSLTMEGKSERAEEEEDEVEDRMSSLSGPAPQRVVPEYGDWTGFAQQARLTRETLDMLQAVPRLAKMAEEQRLGASAERASPANSRPPPSDYSDIATAALSSIAPPHHLQQSADMASLSVMSAASDGNSTISRVAASEK